MKKVLNNLKYLKLKDLFSPLILVLMLPIVLVYRIYLKISKKEIWLICERKDTASDNGYPLFKYIRENHPEVNVYYAIDKKCKDYQKVKPYGNIIQYGGFKHWLYYLSAKKNISTQKSGNPAPALFYVLHVYRILRSKRIFLQHGIIKDDLKFVYYNTCKFDLFVTSAKPEYEYVKEKFGYPEGVVQYLGLARMDIFQQAKVNPKQIVIMPTWRQYLAREQNILGNNQEFTKTDYFQKYSQLINNQDLINYIEKNEILVYFYPHSNMQKYIKHFNAGSSNIKIVENNSKDIQELLTESALLVTDYSSVAMDFAYMKKPLIYYQFDYEEFRSNQYAEGFFSYKRDGFGPVIEEETELVNKIIDYAENKFKNEEKYQKRHQAFFPLYDANNSQRNYEAILKL